MIRLIYEKAARIKVEIVRTVLENRGSIEKENLLTEFEISMSTLEKYLFEMYLELPRNSIEVSKNHVRVNEHKCSLFDTQIFYFSKSITKEVLHECFFKTHTYTLEKLAQNLYVSTSKIFNVLKFLEQQLTEFNVQIVRSPTVSLLGNAESILLLHNLLLQTEDDPYEVVFSKIERKTLVSKILSFFNENNIKCEHKIIQEFELWLLTINDYRFLKKFFLNSLAEVISHEFIDSKSQIYESFKRFFPQAHFKGSDNAGVILAIVFLLFNTSGLHFETPHEEKEFYRTSLIVNYSYQEFLLTLLIKEEYQIYSNSLRLLIFKIEGSLHYYNLLYPYFCLYSEFFNPKLKSVPTFKRLIQLLKNDFSLFFEKQLFSDYETVTDSIYDFLASIISSFQIGFFSNTAYRIGVYSTRGTLFEEKVCKELQKAIEIVPYHEFSKKNQPLDLLLVDDLRLLHINYDYKNYLLFGDSYYDELLAKGTFV